MLNPVKSLADAHLRCFPACADQALFDAARTALLAAHDAIAALRPATASWDAEAAFSDVQDLLLDGVCDLFGAAARAAEAEEDLGPADMPYASASAIY